MTGDPRQEHDDAALDETIEETFPASDPPGNTVETGVRVGPPAGGEPAVVDDTAAGRLELTRDGATAFLMYERRPGTFVIVHTWVPPALGGRGIGGVLVRAAAAAARAEGRSLQVACPFARRFFEKHPDERVPGPGSTAR